MDTPHSFSSGRKTTVAATPITVPPYSELTPFNKIVMSRDGDPSATVYSIDARKFLNALDDDDLTSLNTITLAARPCIGGIGIWDTLFNATLRQGMAACIFGLQNNWAPIPQPRVDYASQFLDLSRAISRVHLNRIVPGDRLGIAIYSAAKKLTYALLYTVVEQCSVDSFERDEDNNVIQVPGFNIAIDTIVRLQNDGQATVVDIGANEPYDTNERGVAFLQHLCTSVYNIDIAFPWKPHFIPWIGQPSNRKRLEARLLQEYDESELITYDEFEVLCREHYYSAKENPTKLRRRPAARDSNVSRNVVRLPIVEVVTRGDFYIVKFDEKSDGTGKKYRFPKTDLDAGAKARETFFTNADLRDAEHGSVPGVNVLSEDRFGEQAYHRLFTVNF